MSGVPEADLARRKQRWLAQLVGGEISRGTRALRISRAALDGSYRRFASRDAILRDVVSLLRRSNMPTSP